MHLYTLTLRYWKQDAHKPLLTGWVSLSYLNLLLQKSHAKVGSGQKLQTTPDWHGACLQRVHHFPEKCCHLWNYLEFWCSTGKVEEDIWRETLRFVFRDIFHIFLHCHSSLSPKERSQLLVSLILSTQWLQWSVQWRELIRERIKPVTVAGFTLTAQLVQNLPAVQETRVRSLGWEDPREKQMATHSSILAWKISWTEEPGGLQSMGLQRVGHNWVTNTYLLTEKMD